MFSMVDDVLWRESPEYIMYYVDVGTGIDEPGVYKRFGFECFCDFVF